MKTLRLRLISWLLLVCMLLSLGACTQTPSDEVITTEGFTETTTPETEQISFSITADYKLLRPDDSEQKEIDALKLLSRGLKSVHGFSCQMLTDFKKPSEELKRNEFEILVGATNRPESAELSASLSYYDWAYKVVNENIIVICGGSPEATFTAVEAFLEDIFGYKENAKTEDVVSAGNAAELSAEIAKAYAHNYNGTVIKIGDRDISEYSLVVSNEKLNGIDSIALNISRITGKNIPIVPIADYKGGPAIFFGCKKADGSHHNAETYGTYRYFIGEEDGNLYVDFKTNSVATAASSRFIANLLSREKIDLGGEILTGLHISNGTKGLVHSSTKTEELAPGVTYVEQLYYNKSNTPVRVYSVVIKKGAASIETTMPQDSIESIGKVSNMKNQLSAAVSNGKNAIVSINADFFDMGGTNIMRGLCIKDGVFIHGAADRPWVGITKDGDTVMGLPADYNTYKDNLLHAVGGSHILLKNDKPDDLSIGTEFADTIHPRTALGVTPDGDIVLMIVDGRQPDISNGATLADLAFLLGTFGCSDGINLDGGGSSTLIVRNGSTYTTKNSPSAGALRAVANGLMVVLK
ncbi:MAG: phosphodiester glycosidase family protein [Clostridia bacterium]|nr:phosphodiester glycosidase family protein [Clostridia bacterium]